MSLGGGEACILFPSRVNPWANVSKMVVCAVVAGKRPLYNVCILCEGALSSFAAGEWFAQYGCALRGIVCNGRLIDFQAPLQEPLFVSTPASTYKVLVIDDSNTIRRSAEIFLKQGGHEVLLAEDGFDALAKVNDCAPQLIFCDILMPRLDGYQTCAIIKRNPKFAQVPVVMLSSKDGVFDKARGRMVGAQDYLTKPFTKDQLLQAVQQFGAVLQGAS